MKLCPLCAEEIQDAAIVCKHCKRDLPPPASAAPIGAESSASVVSVGAATNTRRRLWIALGALGSLYLIGLAIQSATGTDYTGAPASTARTAAAPREDLNPEFSGTNAVLALTNRNSVGWRSTKLILNDTFSCSVGQLDAGQRVEIRTVECTKDDGTRFSPLVHKIVKIQTQAIVGNGFSPDFKTRRFQ